MENEGSKRTSLTKKEGSHEVSESRERTNGGPACFFLITLLLVGIAFAIDFAVTVLLGAL
jgi:hypothetical protein